MEEAGGINLYGFVNNSPANAYDVLGFDADSYWRDQGNGTIGGGNGQTDGFVQWANGLPGSAPTSSWYSQLDDAVAAGKPAPNNAAYGPPTMLPTVYVSAKAGGDLTAATTSAIGTQLSGYIDWDTMSLNQIILNHAGMSSEQAQGIATKLGWNGFSKNLSANQQLYYGETAAGILARQMQGEDVSGAWRGVLSEVPGVITDSNGNMAGDSADLARAMFLVGAGALGGVVPAYLGDTLARISNGAALPYRNDGTVFQNREGLLPAQAPGYYREYVVPTPGNPGPGVQRIVVGQQGEIYYTPDHYNTFVRVPMPGGGDEREPGSP